MRIGGKANQATAELSLQSLSRSSGYRWWNISRSMGTYMTASPLFASNIPTAIRFSRHRRTSILNVPMVVAIVHGTLFQVPISQVPAHACRSGTLLSCKKHHCPSKCHRLSDHSRMDCEVLLSTRCAVGHIRKWKCHDGPRATCGTCEELQRQAAEAAKAEASASLEQREVRGGRHAQEAERASYPQQVERRHQQHMAQLYERFLRLRFRDTRV